MNRLINYPNKEALFFLLQNYEDIIINIDVSEKSRKRYGYDVDFFISFLQENPFDKDVILRYKEYLNGIANYSLSTKRAKLAIAKRLCQYLFDRGITPINYSSKAKNFAVHLGHKKLGMTEEEVQRIFQYLNLLPETIKSEVVRTNGTKYLKTNPTHKLRDLLMTTLLVYQGLRQFEMAEIKIEDINLNDKILLIKGKHRDYQELIHLHKKSVELIQQYLAVEGRKSGFLILSRRKAQMPLSSIQHIYKNIFSILDIKRTVHGFRHYFITTLLHKFGDPSIVMKFARLKSIETIKVYDDRLKLKRYLNDFNEAFNF